MLPDENSNDSDSNLSPTPLPSKRPKLREGAIPSSDTESYVHSPTCLNFNDLMVGIFVNLLPRHPCLKDSFFSLR